MVVVCVSVMDMLSVDYIPGDPMLIENIVWELKSQGIFDHFRKECIADVDTKPAYQNLRQRVEGSVSSFLRKQTWSADLNKNHLREQLRKNIYESGFLEIGVERIVDQVVNPKMNTVFLPKVTDVVYKYLGLTKPDAKSDKEKEEELKTKSEELLPKELEAVSPESRHDDKNDDSNQSFNGMKVDEDESPPFEPLDEDDSIDSHLSGISALQSHDSNSSTKALQIDVTQMSKHGSDCGDTEDAANIVTEMEENIVFGQSEGYKEGDNISSSAKSDSKKNGKDLKRADREKDTDKHRSGSKSRSRVETSKRDKHERKHEGSSRGKDKYRTKDMDHRDRSKDKDKCRSDKDKHRSHNNMKKDDRREKERYDTSNSKRDKGKERKSRDQDSGHGVSYKNPKMHNDKTRPKNERDGKASSSRTDKDKDKRNKNKDKKDDHYSSKHKGERRSTDRDSNDGSGLKSSSSSYCESNSSSQNSQHSLKESSNSNDSGNSGNSHGHESKYEMNAEKCKLIKLKTDSKLPDAKKVMKNGKNARNIGGESNLDSKSSIILYSEELTSDDQIEIQSKTPPSMSVSAASWDEIEAKFNSNVNYDSYYDPDTPDNENEITNIEEMQKFAASSWVNDNTIYLQYFDQKSIERDEVSLGKSMICIENIEKQIEEIESRLKHGNSEQDLNKENKQRLLKRKNDISLTSAIKKNKNNNTVGQYPIIDSEKFHLPLSPAESDSDKSIDKKLDPQLLTGNEARRKSVKTQRYSSEDLYKPRHVTKRTTTRRRGNLEN